MLFVWGLAEVHKGYQEGDYPDDNEEIVCHDVVGLRDVTLCDRVTI